MEQVCQTILNTVDISSPSFSAFVIIMKATKIAFFHFYSYSDLLTEYNIVNFKGLIPLNQLMDLTSYIQINKLDNMEEALKYLNKYSSILTDIN